MIANYDVGPLLLEFIGCLFTRAFLPISDPFEQNKILTYFFLVYTIGPREDNLSKYLWIIHIQNVCLSLVPDE